MDVYTGHRSVSVRIVRNFVILLFNKMIKNWNKRDLGRSSIRSAYRAYLKHLENLNKAIVG